MTRRSRWIGRLVALATVLAAGSLATEPAHAISTATASAPGALSVTVRPAGSPGHGAHGSMTAAVGETVDLEVVLHTSAESLEGYRYGLRWSGGRLGSLALTHVHGEEEPLEPEPFGAFVIDEEARAIRNVNAASLAPGPGSTASPVVLERLSFVVEELPAEGIEVRPFLGPGDAFGVGEGVRTPAFFGITLVPEPAAALGQGAALVALAAAAARRFRRRVA